MVAVCEADRLVKTHQPFARAWAPPDVNNRGLPNPHFELSLSWMH